MNPAKSIGVIAGNGAFPLLFSENAKKHGYNVVAVCHSGETLSDIESVADQIEWIKVGQLGKIIDTFSAAGVTQAVMAGGINRVRLFGGVKLDMRGAALLARLRSTKDDVIMRGIADELERCGIEIISCTTFMEDYLVPIGVMTKSKPTEDEYTDINVGISALQAMSGEDIGQMMVVREGVIVAVEAVEGTDAAIRRGGELGGKGSVIVKFAKTTQDIRFDIPTIGKKTIETMIEVKARVLALESGRCMMLEKSEVLNLANKHKIAIVGCESLLEDL